jgi:hypothetical protein
MEKTDTDGVVEIKEMEYKANSEEELKAILAKEHPEVQLN